MIPTILLAGVAAAQTPPPRPPSAWEWDAPTPAAAPAPPARPFGWDQPAAPAPPAKPARPAFGSWDAPRPAPPRAPAAFADWDAPAAPAPPARPLFVPQLTPPPPAAPPAPQAFPSPMAAPVPPTPPRPFYLKGDRFDFDYDFDYQIEEKLRDAQMKLEQLDLEGLNEKFKTMSGEYAKLGAKISSDIAGKFAYMPQIGIGIGRGRGQSDDRLYENGKSALDSYHWEEALYNFNLVTVHGRSRADGAWYWKAYALNKLGRRDEALAAIAELRKSFASSRWLDDAKALEVEVRQGSGKPVTPESQSDEELKLLALNGLMQTDPDRAFPLLETLLKSAQSPKLRKNAVYVLAQSNSPRAQQLLEQVARGGGNPDLQVSAIRYIGERRKTNGGQILSEVYGSSSDANVKRAILNALQQYRDKDRILQLAKTEKTPELRLEAIRLLSGMGSAQADLWQLYQSETVPEAKQQILEMIPSAGNIDKLVEVARNEKDPKVRRFAIRRLSGERNVTSGDALVSIYTAEQDQEVKRAIIDTLSGQHNAKALVQAARAEKDSKMQQRILERLVGMKSPEASDYLMEILKK